MPEIICPYCFGKMMDDEVLFRSERLSRQDEEAQIIPEEYDDIEDFKSRYRAADRENIIQKYDEWLRFLPKEDPVYQQWWSQFGGTTEVSLTQASDGSSGIPNYFRPIIDPSTDSRFIQPQEDGTNIIRDGNGMAAEIRLKTGEACTRRVCKHCHNPLPTGYGQHPVKFVSVIGITASGKTVYLSQLLRKMRSYTQKVGFDATLTTDSVQVFFETNKVAVDCPLPGATPARSLQQPLFFDMTSSIQGTDRKRVETFVMYDVAGELFDIHRTSQDDLDRFAPFVRNADGIILLIDPMQFRKIQDISSDGKARSEATTVLDQIHFITSAGNSEVKCDTPLAVCISKIDTFNAQMALPDSLKQHLQEDVKNLYKTDKSQLFDAKGYNAIADELNPFMQDEELDATLDIHYSNYAYFAFTSLGCDVERKADENGVEQDVPVGPILPKRIEEPLLWLFHTLGYIDCNARVHYPNEIIFPCPRENCRSEFTEPLEEIKEVERGRTGFLNLKKIKEPVNYHCTRCGYYWWNDEAK